MPSSGGYTPPGLASILPRCLPLCPNRLPLPLTPFELPSEIFQAEISGRIYRSCRVHMEQKTLLCRGWAWRKLDEGQGGRGVCIEPVCSLRLRIASTREQCNCHVVKINVLAGISAYISIYSCNGKLDNYSTLTSSSCCPEPGEDCNSAESTWPAVSNSSSNLRDSAQGNSQDL
jgi:hypothetical protein